MEIFVDAFEQDHSAKKQSTDGDKFPKLPPAQKSAEKADASLPDSIKRWQRVAHEIIINVREKRKEQEQRDIVRAATAEPVSMRTDITVACTYTHYI